MVGVSMSVTTKSNLFYVAASGNLYLDITFVALR